MIQGVTDVPQRTCHGCGAALPRTRWALDLDLRASPECWHAFGLVTTFASRHPDLDRWHQLTLDAYGAQHAGDPTPAIDVARSLVGLQLALEQGFDGPTVGEVRRRMGRPQAWWP